MSTSRVLWKYLSPSLPHVCNLISIQEMNGKERYGDQGYWSWVNYDVQDVLLPAWQLQWCHHLLLLLEPKVMSRCTLREQIKCFNYVTTYLFCTLCILISFSVNALLVLIANKVYIFNNKFIASSSVSEPKNVIKQSAVHVSNLIT
jgi:hypothetical protein